MPTTRSVVESILVVRTGGILARVRISLTPSADPSPRAYLGDPIASAMRSIGLAVANPTNPSDSELALLDDGDLDELLDRAELRTLENVLGNAALVDEAAGIDRQDWGKWLDRIQKRTSDLRDRINEEFGTGSGALTGGTVGLDFQSKADDVEPNTRPIDFFNRPL